MKFNIRFIAFIFSLFLGIILCIPSFFNTSGPKINLGLDIQGGVYMLLKINGDEAVKLKYTGILSSIKTLSEEEQILLSSAKSDLNAVYFEILDIDDKPKIDSFLSKIPNITIAESGEKYTLTLSEKEIADTKLFALEQAISTIRNRLDQFGLSEPKVIKQGDEHIQLEVAGVKTLEEEKRIRDLIARAAHLQMMAVDEDRNARVDSISEAEAESFGDVVLSFASNKDQKILLKSTPILSGTMITDARVSYDNNGQPAISFTLDSNGARLFGNFSGKSVGKRMAIVVDNTVYSAPVIRERIGGGSGQISGNFSVAEASDLAIALRSGALPASISIIEKRSVGPSLGADSIMASLIALIIGFLAVIIFMLFYYSIAGLIANIALLVNLVLIIGVMAIFGATLTLPGMAGIILTIGMAVDANIIINERMREALRAGENISKAIDTGYSNASRAIFDSNVTTLIAAILLFAFGTGAIKGFALTISIGIFASILTAIVGTYGIYQYILPLILKSKNYMLWFGISTPEKTKYAK